MAWRSPWGRKELDKTERLSLSRWCRDTRRPEPCMSCTRRELAGWVPFSTSLGASAPSLRRGGGIGNPCFPHGGHTVGSSAASCPQGSRGGSLLGGCWRTLGERGGPFFFLNHITLIYFVICNNDGKAGICLAGRLQLGHMIIEIATDEVHESDHADVCLFHLQGRIPPFSLFLKKGRFYACPFDFCR